jgi:cysteine synthase A
MMSIDIVLPDDVAKEKVQSLEALGAIVEKGERSEAVSSPAQVRSSQLIAGMVAVRPVSIVDKRHYVNLARVRAQEFGKEVIVSTTSSTPRPASPVATEAESDPKKAPTFLITSEPEPSAATTQEYADPVRGLFSNQFENLSNMAAHEEGTAVEIWEQTNGKIDAFISGAGTGGTIAGVGKFLKSKNPEVESVLSDPQGSGLFHKVR